MDFCAICGEYHSSTHTNCDHMEPEMKPHIRASKRNTGKMENSEEASGHLSMPTSEMSEMTLEERRRKASREIEELELEEEVAELEAKRK